MSQPLESYFSMFLSDFSRQYIYQLCKMMRNNEQISILWLLLGNCSQKKIPTFWSSYLTYLAGDVHNSFVNRAHVDWQVQWHCTEKAPDEFTVQTQHISCEHYFLLLTLVTESKQPQFQKRHEEIIKGTSHLDVVKYMWY